MSKRKDGMTPANVKERALFSCIATIQGRAEMSEMVLMSGLAHCLGADNPAVAKRAAQELARLQPQLMRK